MHVHNPSAALQQCKQETSEGSGINMSVDFVVSSTDRGGGRYTWTGNRDITVRKRCDYSWGYHPQGCTVAVFLLWRCFYFGGAPGKLKVGKAILETEHCFASHLQGVKHRPFAGRSTGSGVWFHLNIICTFLETVKSPGLEVTKLQKHQVIFCHLELLTCKSSSCGF